jgi:hypothetical protein
LPCLSASWSRSNSATVSRCDILNLIFHTWNTFSKSDRT